MRAGVFSYHSLNTIGVRVVKDVSKEDIVKTKTAKKE